MGNKPTIPEMFAPAFSYRRKHNKCIKKLRLLQEKERSVLHVLWDRMWG